VEESDKARRLLQRHGFAVKGHRNDRDRSARQARRPGASRCLDGTGINVEYAYAFPDKHKGCGLLLFRFNDPDAAIQALKARQINPVSTEELTKRLEG